MLSMMSVALVILDWATPAAERARTQVASCWRRAARFGSMAPVLVQPARRTAPRISSFFILGLGGSRGIHGNLVQGVVDHAHEARLGAHASLTKGSGTNRRKADDLGNQGNEIRVMGLEAGQDVVIGVNDLVHGDSLVGEGD